MSGLPTFRRTLREQRTPALAWSVCLFLLAFVHVVLFPQYKEAAGALDENPYYEGLAGAAGGLGTPTGYLNAEFFTAAPLLVLIFVIIAGTGSVAAEAASGTLDLVLAQPVRRARVVLEKSAALALLSALVSLTILPGVVLGQLTVDFDIGIDRLLAACLTIVPLAWFYAAVSIFGGAVLRSRLAASVIVIGAALAGFFLNAFGSFVEALDEPRKVSPFYWTNYGKALIGESDWPPLLFLLAMTAVVSAATVVLFERRDVGTSGIILPWRKTRRDESKNGAVSASVESPEPSRLPATFMRTLREQRVQFTSWGLVVFLLAFVIVAIYPQFKDALDAFAESGVFDELAGGAGSIASPAGYLNLEFFSYVPVIVLIAAVLAGTGALAGEESTGTLDLVLAQPVSRRRLILEKSGALFLLTVAASLVAIPGFMAAALFIEFDIATSRLVMAAVYMVPLAVLFLSMAILAGAALANRNAATILVVGAAIATYFLNTLGAYVSDLDQVRRLSPFYWADFSLVLINGFDYVRALVFMAISAALLVAAVFIFERRDIATQSVAFRLPRRRR